MVHEQHVCRSALYVFHIRRPGELVLLSPSYLLQIEIKSNLMDTE